ncbi:hypothetical protein KFE25_006354 [Diacronema lutheri]|uniref:PITH domain-containing protein n=2 Tax=Diacronema lutheri TaxID=2081491 RepID=A0A8J6CEQ2_DIALT|nr:hypothetical protein KFE25_006354 [Diacronema lutheri]
MHRGPFRCECGELHDTYDESNDLEPYIHTDGVTCLNESVPGACRHVFRPLARRRGEHLELRSDDDDPELLIHVPFTVAVKVRSLVIVGEPGSSAPAHVRAFVNHDGLDFSDAARLPPVQEWDLAREATVELEYPTLRAKFQNVQSITLHVTANHGGTAEPCATSICYIAFQGEGTANKRGIVDAIYEVQAVPENTGVPGLGMGTADAAGF